MKWLKEVREKRGVSQREVAYQVEIAQPTYANIENGKRTPSVGTAKRIGEALGFEWTHFFEKEEKEV